MELKAIKAYLPSFEADHNEILLVSHTKENYAPAKQIECYLKSEADLYIAHQKYKRCLAMAAQYEYKSRYYDLLVKVEASYLLSNPHNVHKYERKAFRSKILRARWRELAEHYKEMAK